MIPYGESMWRDSATLRIIAIIAATLSVANCRRDVSAAENERPSAPIAISSQSKPAQRFDEAAFTVGLAQEGSCRAQTPAALVLQLRAKAPYHVNQEYPHKLKVKPTDGIFFKSPIIARDVMTVDQSGVTGKLDYKPERAGTFVISGEFAFSLCTSDRCLIEKRELTNEVTCL